MNSINYMNLPSYLGNSNFLVNINELTGINNNASGLSATSALQTAISNIQKIVNFDKKQINVNFISNYDTSPIQVLAPLNLSNVNLYQNGNVFVGTGGGASLSSGSTALIINGSTTLLLIL